jgi:hypothetical protein
MSYMIECKVKQTCTPRLTQVLNFCFQIQKFAILYLKGLTLPTCKSWTWNILRVLRGCVESGRAECKSAKRQGAKPNNKLSTLQSAKLPNCRCYKVLNCQIVDVIKCWTVKLSMLPNVELIWLVAWPHPIGFGLTYQLIHHEIGT